MSQELLISLLNIGVRLRIEQEPSVWNSLRSAKSDSVTGVPSP